MASQTRSPGTLANEGAVRVWGNPSGAAASDDVDAACPLGSTTAPSSILAASNFGFTIPAGSTINGIVVDIEKGTNGLGQVRDYALYLRDSFGSGGTDHGDAGTNWSALDGVVSYGSSSDLWGFSSWTADNINATTFGVAFQAIRISGTPTAYVDHIQVTVHYTPLVATGPVAQTLPALTQSAAAVRSPSTGPIAQTLPGLSQSAAAVRAPATGPVAQTLPALTQQATGLGAPDNATGPIAQTLPALTQSATGERGPNVGAVAQALPTLTQAATGIRGASLGPISGPLPALQQAATGMVLYPVATGPITQTLPGLVSVAIGVNLEALNRAAMLARRARRKGKGHETITYAAELGLDPTEVLDLLRQAQERGMDVGLPRDGG